MGEEQENIRTYYYGTIVAMKEAIALYESACLTRQMFVNPVNGYNKEMEPIFKLMASEQEKAIERAINRATSYWTKFKAFGKRR